MIPCIKTDTLRNVLTNIQDAQVVIINEGQFFSDLYEVVLQMIGMGKKIYVGGLDGDFERKKFGQILDLIPLSDKVTKLISLCSICKDGTPGIFSKRITTETEQTVVGSDNYIPVCRSCF
jgi:thymidine kinase